ncbi:TRAP transporter substrate-binding protein DctP [Vibrio amylolyticus]|uniref:TRAP transporter substrate-binding protein n=1 Tax=Vibrio amylolyticus TaxID=2847292 RepID=UPI00355695E7
MKFAKAMANGLTVMVLAASITAVQAADFRLRAVANSNENDEDYDGLVVFKDFVESRSNGKISVELFIGTQLCGNGTECVQALEDGSIDIYVSTSGGTANMYPYVQVLDLPYILADDRIAETVLSGSFVQEMRKDILKDSDNKVRLMTVGNTGGWRNFANTKRTVRSPSDMEGLKIRTVVADLPQELVKSLGASPTPIPWPELYTSFQTGVVEGSKNGITDIMGMKFPEAGLKYVTLDGHAYMAALWLMNNEHFSEMPEGLRKVVVDGFYALQQATFASPKRKSIQAYQDFTKSGGTLYVPNQAEKDKFKAKAQPVYQWFSKNVDQGEKYYQLLVSEASKAEKSIAATYQRELN